MVRGWLRSIEMLLKNAPRRARTKASRWGGNMADDSILYSISAHVGYITLNRPESGNRVNLIMAEALAGICSQINGNQDIYLAVVTGSGYAFCTGGEAEQPKAPGLSKEAPAGISASEAIAS